MLEDENGFAAPRLSACAVRQRTTGQERPGERTVRDIAILRLFEEAIIGEGIRDARIRRHGAKGVLSRLSELLW